MSFRIFALALVALMPLAFAKQSVLQAGDVSAFEAFRDKYFKDYSDDEYDMRLNNFLNTKAHVDMHNSMDTSFKREINEYADWTPEEKTALFGFNSALHRSKAAAPRPLSFKTHMASNRSIKTSVDWSHFLSHSVPNQQFCGSCWAFAGISTLEGRVKTTYDKSIQLSVQEAVSCTENKRHCGGTGGCDGATIELMYEYVMANGGISKKSDYEYTSGFGQSGTCHTDDKSAAVSISGYVDVDSNNNAALMDAIQDGPVAISVDASGWESYASGVFDPKFCGPTINHAVTLVGYGEEDGKKYWKIRNSWGPSWGESGFIKLLRHENDNVPCATDEHPEEGTGCMNGPSSVQVCGSCGMLYASTYPTGIDVIAEN